MVWLTVLLAVVAATAAAVGRGSPEELGAHEVVSARGQAVDVYGTGSGRHDPPGWPGVGKPGTDVVTLFLELPALIAPSWPTGAGRCGAPSRSSASWGGRC